MKVFQLHQGCVTHHDRDPMYIAYVMFFEGWETMKRVSEKSETSKLRMVQAAGAAFREHGLGGIGVDGLAKAANFTSGAFYFHFDSKIDAFVASMSESLDGLRQGIEQFQQDCGSGWLKAFAVFYLGFKRTCGLGEGCALPLLSSEVERAGDAARKAYEQRMQDVFHALERGLKPKASSSSREQALVLMALLVGGVVMSRTVKDKRLSEEIAAAVQKAADTIFKAQKVRVGMENT